jgi:hypothetical protein
VYVCACVSVCVRVCIYLFVFVFCVCVCVNSCLALVRECMNLNIIVCNVTKAEKYTCTHLKNTYTCTPTHLSQFCDSPPLSEVLLLSL